MTKKTKIIFSVLFIIGTLVVSLIMLNNKQKWASSESPQGFSPISHPLTAKFTQEIEAVTLDPVEQIKLLNAWIFISMGSPDASVNINPIESRSMYTVIEKVLQKK